MPPPDARHPSASVKFDVLTDDNPARIVRCGDTAGPARLAEHAAAAWHASC
jgi:hypothetical protein